MSDLRFPASLRPIVSKGYSQTRGNNIWRTDVQGGLPRQGRDTYFEPVPISITLVVSNLGRQAFYSFLTQINGGADSFIMVNDTGYGLADHQVMITSTISDSTEDGKNWVISFTATAERTAIQEENCLTENLPDLFGCYGDCLGYFLTEYGTAQTTFPRIWSNEGPAGYPPIDMLASVLDSRIEYTGPSVNYLNSAGLLVPSAVDEWPVMYIGGYTVGRGQPRNAESNLLKYSRDLSNSNWFSLNLNVQTSNERIFGDFYGFKLIPNSTSAQHYRASAVNPLPTGTLINISAVVKAAGMNVVQLYFAGGSTGITDQYANFDLSNQSTAGSATNRRVTPLGGGWYLCSCSAQVTGDMSSLRNAIMAVVPLVSSPRAPTFSGNGVDGVIFANVQMQNNADVAEPIVTDASVITRAASIAKVRTNKATSIKITYSDASTANVAAVNGYATIPQADSAWGSKYITRIDFIV
nr:MAG TPA: hypothetical protein [Caudoviricetes sp.]